MARDVGIEKLLNEQDWSEIYKRTTAFALARIRPQSQATLSTAEEIAQEAIGRLFDANYKQWDPAREPLLDHLRSVVNGIAHNRWKMSKRRSEELCDPEELARLSDESKNRAVEGMKVETTLYAEKVVSTLGRRLDGDTLAENVFLLTMEGIDRPKDQAAHLQCPVEDIYNAKRRLRDHLEAIRNLELGGKVV